MLSLIKQNKIKLISDENVPVKITGLLIKRNFDVRKAPLGINDSQLSILSKREKRAIITFDKHFINKKLFSPKDHFGIIFIQIHPPTIDKVFSSLVKMLNIIKVLKGKLIILSEQGFRIK